MPQARPKTRKKEAHKNGRTIKTKGHTGKSTEGQNQRLVMLKQRAMRLRAEGLSLALTAETLADEFKLERIPPTTTVFRWTADVALELKEDYDRTSIAYRTEQDAQIDELLRRWMPLALADHLRIQKFKQSAEGPVPYIDEHAYDESLKALDRCLKLMARRARLWNLDLTKVEINTGDGPKTYQDLLLWVNTTLIAGEGAKNMGSAKVVDEPLSLEAGVPDVDIV